MENPIVIDTDAGCDDLLAILLALSSPKWKVVAITCVMGNVSVNQAVLNVRRILHLKNANHIPVYQGCEISLLGKLRPGDEFYAWDGMGGVSEKFPLPKADVQCDHAVNALIALSKQHIGDLTLLTLGPLTNVALAQRLDSEFSSRLKKLALMGGNINARGNVTPASEFNFHMDPEAAAIVCEEFKCSNLIIPYEVCVQHHVSWDWYETWASSNTPAGNFLKEITQFSIKKMKDAGREGYHCCDLLATTAVVAPECLKATDRRYIVVETCGNHTKGQLVVDWRVLSTAAPNFEICMEFHKEMVKDIWMKIIANN